MVYGIRIGILSFYFLDDWPVCLLKERVDLLLLDGPRLDLPSLAVLFALAVFPSDVTWSVKADELECDVDERTEGIPVDTPVGSRILVPELVVQPE